MSEDKRVNGTFTIQAQLGGSSGKTMSMTGYVLDGQDATAINSEIDRMHDAVDRQKARAELPELQAKLDIEFLRLRQLKEHIEGLHKARAELMNSEKLSSVQKKQMADGQGVIDNAMKSLKALEENIDKGMAAIEEAKRKCQ